MSARAGRGSLAPMKLTKCMETRRDYALREREEDGIKLGSGVDPTADGRLDRHTTKKGAKIQPMF